MTGGFSLAFAAGVLAAFNPCGFAMLPAWVGYFLVVEEGRLRGHTLARIGRALEVSALLSAGFLAVFAAAAIAVNLGFLLLNRGLPVATVVLAGVLAAAGATLLGKGHLFAVPQPHIRTERSRVAGAIVLYGLAYGLATISCVLPVFLVAVGAAAGPSLGGRVAGFGGFALGIATVLSVVTLAATFVEGSAARLRRLAPIIPIASGVLLVAAAAYIAHREIPLAALALNRPEPPAVLTLTLTAATVTLGAVAGLLIARRQRARRLDTLGLTWRMKR